MNEHGKNAFWVSLKLFQILTQLSRETICDLIHREIVSARIIEGKHGNEYQIFTGSFPFPSMKNRFKNGENLSLYEKEIKGSVNYTNYVLLKSFQKPKALFWMTVLDRTQDIVGSELQIYCKLTEIKYSTLLRYRKRWRASGRRLSSLKYGWGGSTRPLSEFLSAREASELLGVTRKQIKQNCKDGKYPGAYPGKLLNGQTGWRIPTLSLKKMSKNRKG